MHNKGWYFFELKGLCNKFLKPYDANKPTSYMIYLNANNLYGHSIQFLTSENPLKMMENAFYFNIKALFVFKILKSLS